MRIQRFNISLRTLLVAPVLMLGACDSTLQIGQLNRNGESVESSDTNEPMLPEGSTTDEPDTTTTGDTNGPVDSCDALQQDCPQGELCTIIDANTDAMGCRPDISGDAGKQLDPCELLGSCDPGLVCLVASYTECGENEACCMPFCDPSAQNPCPGPDQVCDPLVNNETVGVCVIQPQEAAPDLGPVDSCDALQQDCPQGELCTIIDTDWNAMGCRPDLSGDAGKQLDPCDSLDSCDPGLVCLVDSFTECGENAACCMPFCDPSAQNPCPGADQVCDPLVNNEDVGTCVIEPQGGAPQPDLGPVDSCDPLQQDCAQGELCTITDMNWNAMGCLSDLSGDTGKELDPCTSLDSCDPGFACLVGDYSDCGANEACCMPFCDPSAPDACPGDQVCDPLLNNENFGVCVIQP